MTKTCRQAILILSTVVVAGCFTGRINNTMQSWVGTHYSQLIMQWGPPQGVYDDGQGGRIFVYTQARQFTTPGSATTMTTAQATAYGNQIWGQAQSVTQFTPPQSSGYTAWRMFRANRDGTIYSWSWKGL
jgi:maltose-binding protein MalE